MHRTGTSLVAGLLNRHGLWLGDEADMMRANPLNPDGYFENVLLVAIDDAILSLFGGSWSSPPAFPESWIDDPRLDPLKEEAREVGGRLAACGRAWGFKDPRAALTLPFWLSVWGDMTVIVTLRNPLASARSLEHRDGMTIERGIELWATHYRSLLEHTTAASRIVVSYEAFCAEPQSSARSLLSRLDGVRDADPDVVRESVRAPLRHFRESLADLERLDAHAALDLYKQLRGEVIQAEPPAGGAPDAISGLDLAIRDVHVEVQRLAALVTRIEHEIAFVRTSDLAGVVAQLEYQRELVERIARELPPLGERVTATEAAVEHSGNGRHD